MNKFILLTASVSFAFMSIAFAKGDDMFVSSPSAIYASNTHTKSIGMLDLGAKVNIMNKKGKWYKVKVYGWSQKGLPSVIYAFNGIRIKKAVLTKDGEKLTKILKVAKDKETGLTWKEVELKTAWINEKYLSKNMKKVWKRAITLFHNRCTMCHALPKSTKFTANQWPSTLRVMSKRAALNKQQTDFVSKFLQYHAKDTIKFAK